MKSDFMDKDVIQSKYSLTNCLGYVKFYCNNSNNNNNNDDI